MSHRRAGFTLFEAMFVIFMMGIVIMMIATMFIDTSRASERATAHTREIRSAAAVLDRIASDLEGAYLVTKPPDADPLAHPWVFIADSRRGQAGADRVLFTTLGHQSSALAIDPEQRKSAAGLATYAYFLEPDEASAVGDLPGFVLMRWVNPFLAEDHTFPRADDPGTIEVAEGVASFSLHFLAEGGWVEEWDSTLIAESSELPLAVEIRLGLWPELSPADWEALDASGEAPEIIEYRKRVVLYQRPLADVGISTAAANLANNTLDEEEEDDACPMRYDECFQKLGLIVNPRSGIFAKIWTNCVRPGDTSITDASGNPIDVSACLR